MEAVWNDDEHDEFRGDAKSYKTTDGKVVFLTQAESYHHCGLAFAHFSQLEYKLPWSESLLLNIEEIY
jgi:hypothetical protein